MLLAYDYGEIIQPCLPYLYNSWFNTMFKTVGITFYHLSVREVYCIRMTRIHHWWEIMVNEYSQYACLIYLTWILFLIPGKNAKLNVLHRSCYKKHIPPLPRTKVPFIYITLVCQRNVSTKGHLRSGVGWGVGVGVYFLTGYRNM